MFESYYLDFVDNLPYGHLWQYVYQATLIMIFHVGMYYMWYYNYYGVSTIYYIIYYIHIVSTYALIFNAKNRYKNDLLKH